MVKRNPLATTLHDRSTLIHLFIAAVILGLGVNLLASFITELYAGANTALLILSCSLIILSIALIARQTIPTQIIKRDLSGFIIFRSKSSQMITVPRYEYSEEIKSYLEGLFSENSAPKKLWETDPVHKGFEFDETHGAKRRQTEAGKLIVEATEYYVLEKLSTHLTDYFNKLNLDSKRLKQFAREDVADIVFKNRFLDTFSRPMQERAAFMRDTKPPRDSDRIVASFHSNGVRFSKFDLTLPAGATVQRLSANSICINTPKFCLTISVEFSGMNTNLPRGFEVLYLGGIKFSDTRTYTVGLSTNIEFKRWSLLSRSAWDYHAWLDSFLQSLERDFDKKTFLNSIQWEAALTVARLVENTITTQKNKDDLAT